MVTPWAGTEMGVGMKIAGKVVGVLAIAVTLPAPAHAQYAVINDVIANVIMSMGSQDQACVVRNVKEFE